MSLGFVTCPSCARPQPRSAFVCAECKASLTEITVGYADRYDLAQDREILEAEGWQLAGIREGGAKTALAVKYRRWLWRRLGA